MKLLGKNMLSERTGEKRSGEFSRQRIFIALLRGSAACVQDTFCGNKKLDEVYYVLKT